MSSFEVTSELYSENEFQKTDVKENGHIVAKFYFSSPTETDPKGSAVVDKDGDLEVTRRSRDFILIETSQSTALQLVGLQVWRGALLINDYIIHNRDQFMGKRLLELGSGVGLSGILAAKYCSTVCCTDLDMGGILALIRSNVSLNKHLELKANVEVAELDFMRLEWTEAVRRHVENCDYILAADVIYDDTITEALIRTIERVFQHSKPSLEMLVALEKRFVFTLEDLDSVAPSFEHFLRVFDKQLRSKVRIEYIPISEFGQYFEYNRVKQLVLMKLTRIN